MHIGSLGQRFLGWLFIGSVCSLIACAGGGGSPSPAPLADNPPASVSIAIRPVPGEIGTNAPLSLGVDLTGTTDTAVTWLVDGVEGGSRETGEIVVSGSAAVYIAPPTGGTHTLTAVSHQDRTRQASCSILVKYSGYASTPASAQVANVMDPAYGARGDGLADDTDAIQKAVDAMAGTGGTVFIPEGRYNINATRGTSSGYEHGIRLQSDMVLHLSKNAVLKAIPNASPRYSILKVDGARNVTILGGTLEGDRTAHTGTTGEWGMGLNLINAQNVVVEGVVAKECWGDGFYITGACQNVVLCNVDADHNRRQGLSIISGDGITVVNSVFRNTAGTLPEAGVDLEPTHGQTIRNVSLKNCLFKNNAGGGLICSILPADTGISNIQSVSVENNAFVANGVPLVYHWVQNAVLVSNCEQVRLLNNVILSNMGRGILLANGAKGTILEGNLVANTVPVTGQGIDQSTGVWLLKCEGTVAGGNRIINNAGYGLLVADPSLNLAVQNNTISGNGKGP